MEDDSPARPVVSRSPVKTVRLLNLRGIFDRPAECESALERDFVYRAALCPTVTALRHQPFRLKLASGRTYVPDFLIRHRNGSGTVVEVKPDFRQPAHAELFDEAAELLDASGLRFVVVGEGAVRSDDTHKRAALVLRYLKSAAVPGSASAIAGLIGEPRRSIPIGFIRRRCGLSAPDVFHLIATRRLATASSIALHDSAHVFLPSRFEGNHEVCIEDWLDVAPWRSPTRGCSVAGRG